MSFDLTPLMETDENFLDHCICKEQKGIKYLDPDKSVNYEAAINYHPAFKGVFAWDEFDLSPKMVNIPIWMPEAEADRFRPHRVTTEDIIQADYQMQRIGLNGSTEKTKNAIYVGARKNPLHPAREYFNKLEWDGKPRLATWLTYYCGAEYDDPDYLAAVGTKWMCAAVARVMVPGIKFDNMLILEGDQDAYKSTTLRELSTFGEGEFAQEYFTDAFNLANAENKDELAKLAGVLIVEISELDGFHKRENTFLKAFISRQTDQYRVPYGSVVETYPRQFVFAGTYNPTGGVFSDPTGARRFWPVKVGKKIDISKLKADKEQLWAEAVYRYKQGEKLYLPEELKIKAADAAAKRRIVDEWNNDVMDAVGNAEFVEVRNIMKTMGLDITTRTSRESRRIGDILRANGWQYVRRVKHNKQVYGWENPHNPWPTASAQEEEIPVTPEPPPREPEPETEPIEYDFVNNF